MVVEVLPTPYGAHAVQGACLGGGNHPPGCSGLPKKTISSLADLHGQTAVHTDCMLATGGNPLALLAPTMYHWFGRLQLGPGLSARCPPVTLATHKRRMPAWFPACGWQ